MRGQHPGMPQPQSRQQSGYDDMQLWQQQLMFKQLQEFQRQQQIRQSGEEFKHQNLINQISAVTKQTVACQLPAVVNGVPLHDTSNFTWQGEYAGNDVKALNSSQMFLSGNLNLAQRAGHSMHELSNGLALSQDQAQSLQPFGFVPQQHDQSLYGLPVSGNRGWSNQYLQLHGFSQPQDLSDAMSKGGTNAAFNSLRSGQSMYHQQGLQDAHVACRQDFPEKRLFGQLPADSLKNGISTTFEQVNPLGRGLHVQEFHARQEQSYSQGNYSQGNYQEKPCHDPTPSSVCLDPTEQKILFSSDDDTSWDAFGMSSNMNAGGYLHRNPLEGNNLSNSFPSFQGGSWSALMQSAVAEVSSNDTGLKEEWSGLSLQKPNIAGGNHGTLLGNTVKPQTNWFNNSLQGPLSLQKPNSASGNHATLLGNTVKPQTNWFNNSLQGPASAALGPDSTFENGNTSIADHKITGFQQSSAKYAGDQSETGQNDAHYGSLQQSVHFSSPNVHNPLTQQQNISSFSSDIQLSSKGDGWLSNDLQPSCVKAPFKVADIRSSMQHGQMNDSSGTMYADKSHGNSMWSIDSNRVASSLPNSADGLEAIKSSLGSSQMQIALGNSSKPNKGRNTYEFNEHDFDHGKHLLLDSSQSATGKENLGSNPLLPNKRSRAWESFPSNSDKVSGEAHDREQPRGSQKELSNDSYISTHSHPDSSDSGGVTRAGAETHSYAHSNQNFHGQVGQKGSVPRKFQYHPMGNLGFVTEVNDSRKKSFTQEQDHMPFGDSKNYQGYPQQASSSSIVDMNKGCVKDAERTARGSSQANSSCEFQVPPLFDGSVVVSPQSKRPGQTSQNMLELINKVDQSRVSDSAKNYADQTLLSQRHEPKVSDGHFSNPRYNQASPFQGFSLQLGPPFERPSVSNNAMHFSPQAATDNDVQPRYPDREEKSGTWPNTIAPDQPMRLTNDAPKTDGLDGQPNVPRKTSKETSESSTQSKYMASIPTNQSYTKNQSQNRQILGTSTDIPNDQSSNPQFGVRNNFETESKHQQSNNSHTGNVINASSQNSFSDLPSGVSPFRFASPQDIRSSLVLQSGSPNGSNTRSSSQQSSEPRVSLQPSLAHQVGFSGNFPNLWSNFSAQRLPNNFLQKGVPNSLQSMSPNSFRTPSWIPPKVDIQDHVKGCNTSSIMGACVVNSQKQTSEEEWPSKDNFVQQFSPAKVDSSSHGQEPSGIRVSDGSLAMPSQPTVKMDQKDSSNRGQNSSSNLQRGHQTSNHETHGFVFRPPDAQNQNYSLLQQVQALRALEADQNNRLGKRLKGTDCNMESQRFTGKIPQNLKTIDGYNAGVRGPGCPTDNELSAIVQRGSFPSNSRMLSFSSTVNEDQNASKITRDSGMDFSCQDLSISKPGESLNNAQSIGVASTFSSARGIEDGQVKSHHAPLMHDENGSLQQNTEVASECYLNSKSSESTCSLNVVTNVWQNTSISASDEQSMLISKSPEDNVDHDLAQRPKKRKSAELLPWHLEIIGGSHWLHSIRMAETDWAQATNRLIEKVEDEAETSDDGSSILRSRRRLILTTHLMQQLMPSIPAAILVKQPATTGYELIMFLVAKLGLGDSCSLVSSLANGVGTSSTVDNMRVGKFKNFERSGDQHFLKVLENFVGRAGKLESDLLRYEKRASILDVRVECQDLERFSIINRFAKFHGRSQTEGSESSSTSETNRKTFPQRFVTAISMPGNPPEGLACLSL